MTPEHARYTALGYAWAAEDFGQGPTAARSVVTGMLDGSLNGPLLFSAAYAQGRADYDAQRRGSMLPVQDAYRNWQDSEGRSVFKRGDLTLSDAQQTILRQIWWQEADPRKPEYHRTREAMQNQAWDALTPAGV